MLPQLSSTPPPVPDAPVLDELLAVSLDRSSGTVTVSGELDRESAHHLLDALDALRATSHRTWSVDASQVVFCDAAGLRALAAAQALATRHGRELRVVACSRCVERLLVLTGLEALLGEKAPRRPSPTVLRPAPRGLRTDGLVRLSRPGRRRTTG